MTEIAHTAAGAAGKANLPTLIQKDLTEARRALPTYLKGSWSKLRADYTVAQAEMTLAYAQADCAEVSDQAETKHEIHTTAVNAILLTPAETAADIRFKIEVIAAEEIADGWWCAEEAMALLAIDAKRLLPVANEAQQPLEASHV
ncbi:hypothetical protein H0274_13735 [Altererythrobacter sp. CC-YST694]|uniref:hypothetical protein n=1 Tax=Altererythrobacter sp. CC-YST694 TaxID=2755038 RepID=UPI001D005F7C|nr:hypothetical protein [Altererythrobacter sp. CC-YST694]MCB5426324.1 hypothetical protein [Altererythrobacter sp. CC-YST694]